MMMILRPRLIIISGKNRMLLKCLVMNAYFRSIAKIFMDNYDELSGVLFVFLVKVMLPTTR